MKNNWNRFADQLDVLNEDMYTKDEIRRSFDSLCTAVRSSVLTDLQMTANMSMLVLRQLLEEAEASEIDMDLDMTIIEDQSLLAEASKVSIDAPTRKRRNQKNVKLGGIRDEHQRMMSEFEGVKKQNAELLEAKGNLEGAVKDGKRKRKGLREEITELRDQLELQGLAYEDLKKEKDRALAVKEAEIVDMKQKMDDMSAEFGDMLKATLEKMSERINITNSNFDADLGSTGVPTEDKQQEFHLKK